MPSLAGEPAVIPRPDSVRIFFDSLAAQDFPRLASAFSDDVHLRALLPGEFREWDGAERVTATFKRGGRWLYAGAAPGTGPRRAMSAAPSPARR